MTLHRRIGDDIHRCRYFSTNKKGANVIVIGLASLQTMMLAFLLLNSISVRANETLKFYTSENAPVQDISEKVLIEAYHQIGYAIDVQRLPNVRALKMSKRGNSDGELSRIKGIDIHNTKLIRVPVAINIIEGHAFFKKRDLSPLTITDWDSLRIYKLSCVRGIRFIEIHLQKSNMNCQYVTLFTQAINLLTNGRIDIAVLPKLNALHAIEELSAIGIVTTHEPLIKLDLYHYLNVKHIDIVPRLTAVLLAMTKNGRTDEIREQFIAQYQ